MVIALAAPASRARTAAVSLAVASGIVAPSNVTRPLLEGAWAPGSGAWAASAPPYPPPAGESQSRPPLLAGRVGKGRRMNATGAEAPRPAHARIDGRSPGSRVTARHRLPGLSPVALWYGLAAYSCGGSCGIENPQGFRTAFPVVPLIERPSIAV